jgi:hypothetical protein
MKAARKKRARACCGGPTAGQESSGSTRGGTVSSWPRRVASGKWLTCGGIGLLARPADAGGNAAMRHNSTLRSACRAPHVRQASK